MKHLTQILAMLLFSLLAFSQNYQAVNPANTAYFSPEEDFDVPLWFRCPTGIYGPNNPIRSVRIDSVEPVVNGILLWNFTEIQDDDFSSSGPLLMVCVYENKPSWIGKKIIIRNNGNHVFINRNEDSLFVHALAGLNESWQFYKFANGDYFLATITSHDTMSFLGVNDSIKFISLEKYNSNNEPISSGLNGTEIGLSENYGFVKTINFRDFPDFGYGTYPVVEHLLAGHSEIDAGFHLLTKGEVYDFDLGDEFHFTTSSSSWGNSSQEWQIRIVTGKELTLENEITYTFSDEIWGNTPQPSTYHYFEENVITISNLDVFISEYSPFEPIHVSDEFMNFSLASVNKYNSRPRIITTEDGYAPESNCYMWAFFDSYSINSKEFIEGCGMLNSYYSVDSGNEAIHNKMMQYFKKGDEEWGTPLVPPPIGIAEHKNQAAWISPNPASDYMQIFTKEDVKSFSLNIMDASGKQVRFFDNLIPGETIQVSGWPDGMYFYQITTNLFSGTGKIVVKH